VLIGANDLPAMGAMRAARESGLAAILVRSSNGKNLVDL
jgi:ABC-type sugar transport system substrate-binding protein